VTPRKKHLAKLAQARAGPGALRDPYRYLPIPVLPFFLGLLAGGAVEALLRRCLSLLFGVNLSFLAT